MDKKEIISAVEEIGTLLDILGENPFKVRAFLNAARVLEGLSDEPAFLIAQGTLTEVKGIGAGLAEKITEMVQIGKSTYLLELRQKIPPGVLDIMRIPGMGPRKAKALCDELDLHSLGELEYACSENRLVDLKGFGAKTQENILKGIALLKKTSGRFLLDVAWTEAKHLQNFLTRQKGVEQCLVAGSLRRFKETVGDVDLLVSMKGPSAALMKTFTRSPQVEDILAEGETKSSVRMKSGLQVDLRVVSEKEFPFALLYFTGSKEHNTALRGIAKNKGLKLNEYGLYKGEKAIPCKDEAEIYKAIGLHYIPPEARENQGEIEWALERPFPRLVEDKDLRGIFHVHSTWSDGRAPILAMAQEAERLGFEYLGLSDHSQTAVYANGLKPADLKKQAKEVSEANKKLKKLKIIQGTESDILADGALDYPEQDLKQLSFVIASIHSRFKMDKKKMTQRLVKAISNPYTKIVGHLSGRLLLARDSFEFDLDPVLSAAAKNRVAIEINANPHRLDIDWRFLKKAKEAGVKFCIDPDAHSVEGIADTFFGVGIARKGWLTKEDILNTRPLEEVQRYFKS